MRRTVPLTFLSAVLVAFIALGNGAGSAASAAQSTTAPTQSATLVITAPATIVATIAATATTTPTTAATTAPTTAATQVSTTAATTVATTAATTAPTTAATSAATQPATVATARPTAAATGQATDELAFAKYPAPEAGSLGVTLSDSDPVIVRSTFPDGPAEKAGIQPGDEILEVDGTLIRNREELVNKIVATKPGGKLTITIRRDNSEEKIEVPVLSRRAVYCPVAEPKLTEGAAIIKDAFNDAQNWTLAGDSTEGIDKVVGGGKLSFSIKAPEKEWAGLVTLRAKTALEYAVSVDITQTGAAVAGILLNVDQRAGNYQVQFLPNGSWQMSATVDGANSPGGLSFGESILNAQADPSGTVTNSIKIVTDGNDIFFYFNGKFACGAPLFIFADPPLDAGTIALYALAGADKTGKAGVTFSNFTYTALRK